MIIREKNPASLFPFPTILKCETISGQRSLALLGVFPISFEWIRMTVESLVPSEAPIDRLLLEPIPSHGI
jgi:hypothetical protein